MPTDETLTTTRRDLADRVTTTLIMASIMAVGLGGFLELLADMPLPRWMYISVGGLMVAAGIAAMTFDPVRRRLAIVLVTCLFALAILAALHLIPWSSRKPFLQRLNNVRIGMSEAEAREVMSGYMVGTGLPAMESVPGNVVASGVTYHAEVSPSGELALKGSVVFRHSDNGRFNADWGVVTFRNGKVCLRAV